MKSKNIIPKDVAIKVEYNYLVINGVIFYDKLGNKASEVMKGLNLHSLDSLIYALDMGHHSIGILHERLIENGLKLNQDYIIDTAHSYLGVETNQGKLPNIRKIEFEVEWLTGAQDEKGTFLWRSIRSVNNQKTKLL